MLGICAQLFVGYVLQSMGGRCGVMGYFPIAEPFSIGALVWSILDCMRGLRSLNPLSVFFGAIGGCVSLNAFLTTYENLHCRN